MVSVKDSPLPLQQGSSLTQYGSDWVWPCVNKSVFTETGNRPDLARGLQLANPYPRGRKPGLLKAFSPDIYANIRSNCISVDFERKSVTDGLLKKIVN